MSPPRATYRIQLSSAFTLTDAADLVPYLDELGISHLYCSPYLRSAPGSPHGYDVVDHNLVDRELGGEEALEELCRLLEARRMSHILDFVPNHMAVTTHHNRWWWDVLKNGPASRYARFFDIDWDPPESALHRNIMLPVLGERYGRALESGSIVVEERDGEPVVRYGDHLFPIASGTASPEELESAADAAVLHEILERQHYRLAYWRAGDSEVNYRRFFDIKSLAALRIEDPEVFREAHTLVRRLVQERKLSGLRIDHIDGLRDPQRYLERLRSIAGKRAYIVVEKILEADEELPESWPVEGTTGYDFAALVLGLFLDPRGLGPLDELYRNLTGDETAYHTQVYEKKVAVGRSVLASDLERLTELFVKSCETSIHHRDFTRGELRDALLTAAACFPVYRTYVRPQDLAPEDALRIDIALQEGKARRPDLDPEIFERLRTVLQLQSGDPEGAALAARFQQFTGPLMAKGVEDTLFYTYSRFIASNEVGGSPAVFGRAPSELHAQGATAANRWPTSMLSLSTHDSKRSADVRARLALLSEIPERWGEAVAAWTKLTEHDGPDDPAMRYFFFQTLVGAWPLEVERAVAYMTKAAREAKARTSWTDPDEDYESALADFVRACIRGPAAGEIEAFLRPLIRPGRINSLAQSLIHLTWPGVPDIYQGDELWQLNLVDPDNRRPVDFDRRRTMLDMPPKRLGDPRERGSSKLHLVKTTLALRKEEAYAFSGGYDPLEIDGGEDAPAFGFVRGGRVCTIVPRLVLTRGSDEAHASLPRGRWQDVFTGRAVPGGEIPLNRLLAGFPVALLVRD